MGGKETAVGVGESLKLSKAQRSATEAQMGGSGWMDGWVWTTTANARVGEWKHDIDPCREGYVCASGPGPSPQPLRSEWCLQSILSQLLDAYNFSGFQAGERYPTHGCEHRPGPVFCPE